MPRVRYTFAIILSILFIIPCGLRAQGFERDIVLPDVVFVGEIRHYALPSNALLFGSEQNFALLDENGQTLFTRLLPDDREVHGLSASSNGDTLIVHSVKQEPSGTFAYRHYYDLAGDSLGEISTQLQPLSSARYAPGGEFAFTRPDGGSIVVYTFLVDYDGSSSPDEANRVLVANVAPDGNLEGTESFEIPDYFFNLQEIDTLADGSMAVLLSIDTLNEEGEIDLVEAEAALYHFYPAEDTLRRVSEFIPDADAGSFISNTSGTRYAFGRQNSTAGPVIFSIYDLADDSFQNTLEIPTSEEIIASPLNVLDAPDGGYFVHEGVVISGGPGEDNFTRVRQVDDAGTPVRSYSGNSAFGDLVGADVFGRKPNGNLYGAMYDPARTFAQPPGYHYFYFELDENLQSFTNLIRGGIYPETAGGNCIPDLNLPGLANWWVTARPTTPGLDTLYAFTDGNGRYAIVCDSAEYLLSAIPPNSYFAACPGETVTPEGSYDTVGYDFAVEILFDCPLVNLSLSATPFEGCEEGFYSIAYLNTGAIAEENPVIIVELDSFFNPTGSSPPWTSQEGNTLIFELDPIEVNEMGFVYVNGFMDCAAALPGQTHCTEARILPDTFCLPPDPAWDGSSIEVSGSCVDDTVRFQLQNVGLDMETELSYIIIEDFVIHLGEPFILPTDGTLNVDVPVVEGRAYIMESEQAPHHPGSSSPAVGVEGCGDFDPETFSLGLVAQYPQDEGDPFIAILCAESSADAGNQLVDNSEGEPSAQLSVSPSGIGPERLVDTAATIDYTIRFRDPEHAENALYRVLVEGQLPAALDLTTLRPGAASHPYEFSVSATGKIRFVIRNADNTSLDFQPAPGGWGGFVEFSVSLRPGLDHGSQFCFQPGVTLNARAVEVTEEQCLTVRKPQRYGVITQRICLPDLEEPQITRTIDSFPFAAYDSILLTIVNEAGSFEVNDFLSVAVGDTIAGQVITADTIFEELLQTAAGCDSLVTYYVITTGTYEPARDLGLTVFPNPTYGELFIQSEANGRSRQLSNLRLFDLLGRSYVLSASPASLNNGTTMSFDLGHLPPGQYILTGRNGSRSWFRRIILR